MVYESKSFPQDLRAKMYEWTKANCASEKKEGETDEQFIYKARKKALGQFKKDIMRLSQDVRSEIVKPIEEKFEFLFKQLNVPNTKELVDKHITLKRVIKRKRAEEKKEVVHDGEGAD
jgi:hypothetical protein